jgi:VWFA-related protein
MRTLGAVLACFIITLSARASTTPVTVAQLEQAIAAGRTLPDAKLSVDLSALQLTQRLSPSTLAHLQAELPGPQSRQQLSILSAQSSFLDLPPAELPSLPAPDMARQRQIMAQVVSYVTQAIRKLPDFIATRRTRSFQDRPAGAYSALPPHFTSQISAEVEYRDGQERENKSKGDKGESAAGLVSWGEFGPILNTVLLDAAKSQLAWGHWESGAGGAIAVFHYSVPARKSHYQIQFCCISSVEYQSMPTSFAASTGQSADGGILTTDRVFRERPPYHGEMAVDPSTGAILRLTVIADLEPGDPLSTASIAVQYGPVEIGGKTYICPLRSEALARRHHWDTASNAVPGATGAIPSPAIRSGPTTTQINEVTFTGYHVYRGESRVLTEAEAAQMTARPSTQPAEPPPAIATTAPAESASTSELPSPATPTPGTPSVLAPSTPPTANPPPPPRVEANAEPEMSITAATNLPQDSPHPVSSSPNTGFTLRTTTRLVEVAVVATDKHGRPITDLKSSDLALFDNGRPQRVKDFAQAGAGGEMADTPATGAQSTGEEPAVSNRPAAGSTAARQDTGNTTVLLIDAGHIAFSDLTYARGQILRFLTTVPADERVGLYILHSYGFQVLLEPTTDHQAVSQKLAAWMPSAQDLLHAQDEEARNRQQIEMVHSTDDLAYVNGSGEGGNDPEMYSSVAAMGQHFGDLFSHPPDAQLRHMGNTPEQDALYFLISIGRHLAALPGHKTLVWIASDNVLADWSSSAGFEENMTAKTVDPIAVRARETLNEAHASIYPLDVSQLEGGGIDAAQGERNVGVIGVSGRDINKAQMGSNDNINGNGRDTVRMNQDTHPIQTDIQELAKATGGRTLRRSGDIAAELSSIVADGRAAYLLSFSPQTPSDGKYHVLTVKCLRKGVNLRYRTGYLYVEEPATMKERFRDAVWQPQDDTDIGLTAELVREAKAPAVRLHISAADLELFEQDSRWTDKIDVFLVVRDDSGLRATVGGKRLGLALTPTTWQRDLKEGLTVEERLPKTRNGELLRLIVIDENSRRMGSITVGTEE